MYEQIEREIEMSEKSFVAKLPIELHLAVLEEFDVNLTELLAEGVMESLGFDFDDEELSDDIYSVIHNLLAQYFALKIYRNKGYRFVDGEFVKIVAKEHIG